MGKESHYNSKKDRVFLRAIAGPLQPEGRADPSALDAARDQGLGDEVHRRPAVVLSKHFVEPVDGLTQTLHVHLEEYAPGGRTQKHGHVNEAAFYILDGTGYEIHDGIRYDWDAGDVAIVHNNCVHQHFNKDPLKPARALVIKPKPMMMFMNMLFQQQVIPRPTEPTEGGEDFEPRHFEQDYNHDAG